MLSDKLDNYFSGVDDRLADLTGQVSKIYGDMWAVTGAIIAILLAAIAYLIQNHGL